MHRWYLILAIATVAASWRPCVGSAQDAIPEATSDDPTLAPLLEERARLLATPTHSRALPIVLITLGAATTLTGAVLLAIQPTDLCDPDPVDDGCQRNPFLVAGGVTLGVGLATLVTGAVLARRWNEARRLKAKSLRWLEQKIAEHDAEAHLFLRPARETSAFVGAAASFRF